MKIQTGRGTIPLITLIAIWSISALTSLPGLAVSPILGDLTKIFPKATDHGYTRRLERKQGKRNYCRRGTYYLRYSQF